MLKKYPLMGKLVVVKDTAWRSMEEGTGKVTWGNKEDSISGLPRTGWVVGYVTRYSGDYLPATQYGYGGYTEVDDLPEFDPAILTNRVAVKLLEVKFYPTAAPVLCFPESVVEWQPGDPIPEATPTWYRELLKTHYKASSSAYPRDDKGRFTSV